MQTNERAIIFRLLRYAKKYKKLVTIAFFTLFITTIGEMIMPLVISKFIDNQIVPNKLFPKVLLTFSIILITITILKSISLYFQRYFFSKIALYIIHDIRMDIFEKVERLNIRYFDSTPVGSMISRVTNDTETIKDFYIHVVGIFIQSFMLILGILTIMIIINPKLALICAVLLPIVLVIMLLYRKKSSYFYQKIREKLSELNAKMNETLQGVNIIQAFQQEKRMVSEFEKTNDLHFQFQLKKMKLDALFLRPAIDFVFILVLMGILSFFGIQSFDHVVEIGLIYLFVNYLERFVEPINEMMMRLSLYQQAIVSSNRVFEVLESTEEENYESGIYNETVENIKCENLSFSYNGIDNVLNNVSFEIEKGTHVAFVGHTGSGKSTIMSLLLRFYEHKLGSLLFNEKDARNFSLESVRKSFGLVLQDSFIFAGTVRENITLGEKFTDEEVYSALDIVQATEFVKLLPKGLDELLEERGGNLSSGQKQLLTFARAMIRNPSILILDEATSHIDSETEEYIQNALKAMQEGRTTVAIAHRLSTIQDADCIYVLHKGEIVEKGNHEQLLQKKGRYYWLYQVQNVTSEIAK